MLKMRLTDVGFTIVEIIISMFITLIGVLGTYVLFTNVILINDASSRIAVATMLAQQEMENMKRRGFNNFSTYTNISVTGNPHYSLSTTKTPFGSVSAATVSAQVSWINNSKNVLLQTILVK